MAFDIENLESKIYLIRGQRGMLDSDLAELYGVETRALNRQVKRNLIRFPDDFMFRLSFQEFIALRSQIATSKNGRVLYCLRFLYFCNLEIST